MSNHRSNNANNNLNNYNIISNNQINMNELRKSNSLNNLSKLVLDDMDSGGLAQQPQRLSLMDKKRQKWNQELSKWSLGKMVNACL